MKLKDLSYLAAIAKTLHFGKAAEMVHVSQPTLSVQLKKLEDRLGVVLVERNNKHVRLTPAGKAIAEKAILVFREMDGIKALAETLKDPLAGDLHLGIIPTLGPYLLPNIMPELHAQLPKLSLWLHEAQTKTLLQQLHAGEMDIAILSPPILDDTLTVLPLFKEPFLFAVHRHHRLAERKSVSLDDIQSEKILLLTDGHCFADQVLSLCHRVHIEPISFRGTSLETLRYMVVENLGCTLIPQLAAQTVHPDIVYIPFKKPVPTRELALVYRKTHVRENLFNTIAKIIGHVT